MNEWNEKKKKTRLNAFMFRTCWNKKRFSFLNNDVKKKKKVRLNTNNNNEKRKTNLIPHQKFRKKREKK